MGRLFLSIPFAQFSREASCVKAERLDEENSFP